MEDTHSGTIGTSTTPVGSPVIVLMDEDSSGTPSSRNSQIPTQHKQAKTLPVNQSIVWDHFKKVEPIDNENPKAMCNYCNRLIGCHIQRQGISPMMTHLTSNCANFPLRKPKLAKNQTLLQMSCKKAIEGTSSPQIGYVKYDSDRVRRLLVQYFILCELPFSHVETEGFKLFVNGLEPRFNVPNRITMQRDCLKLYGEEKLQLKALMSGQRICLTTDTWTSIQNLNYMCVTAHFIDCDWVLHKKILKFCLIPNHKGDTIGKVLENTMLDWRIHSIFTITIDNASSNDVGIDYVRRRIKEKNSTVLGGEFLHMRCATHILNLIVNDGLKELEDSICNVRNAVKFVRSSPSKMAKFKRCIERLDIRSKKMVCLDVPTRWNSTYLMLSTAEKYQRAFELLGEEDDQLVVPGFLDWENARAFVKYLKTFYDATLIISSSNYVTASLFFMQLCIIQDALNDGCLNSDPILSAMAISMRSKYEKYWGSMDKINLMLYIAFVVDPRYKMKILVWWLKRCNGPQWADKIEKMVRELLNRLIEQYSRFQEIAVSQFNVTSRSADNTFLNVVDDDAESAVDKIHYLISQHLKEEKDLECMSEVDRYLLDGCEATTKDFDVLGWWKINASKYPILAAIARDILAMPISTVVSQSAFCTKRCILDPFRSTLSPLTVEALICTQNWIKNTPIDIWELEEFVEIYDEEGTCL
jgi:hypothetical protein